MTLTNNDVATKAENVRDLQYLPFENSRYMKVSKDVKMINPFTGQEGETIKAGSVMKFSTKINTIKGWSYRTKEMSEQNIDNTIPSDALEEMPKYENFITPRDLKLNQDTDRINPYTGEIYDTLEKGRVLKYTSKIYINNKWYYRTECMTNASENVVVPSEEIQHCFSRNFRCRKLWRFDVPHNF